MSYVSNHRVPGQLEAKVVRSPYPHARIVAVDAERAGRVPGVVAVLAGADVLSDGRQSPVFGRLRSDQPILAYDRVRYAGEPVALVVGTSLAAVEAARSLVDVQYEVLPHVVDAVEAGTASAPQLHREWPGNGCGEWAMRIGDMGAGWREADIVVEGTYYSPPASHVPMEPHCCVSAWEGERLHVITTTQAPHRVRQDLETIFRLAEGQVRVETFDLGGAFGAKGQTLIEPMAAFASRVTSRPVRIELDREEVFLTIGKHAATVRLSTGARRDGTLVARRIEVVYNAGAYALSSPHASGQGLVRSPGPYRIANVEARSVARYTNTVPTGPFRGAMTSQLAFAYESQMDEIAAALSMDPVAIRRRNLLCDGDVYATGERLHDLHYEQLLNGAASAIEWGENEPASSRGRSRGKGIALIIKTTLTPSRSEARLELQPDGRVTIWCSGVELGQGARETFARMAAAALDMEDGSMLVARPDTDVTPFDSSTSSSRTTASMGAAIAAAAADLRLKLTQMAAVELRVPEASIVHARGAVLVEGQGLPVTYAQIREGVGAPVVGEGHYQSEGGLSTMNPLDVHGTTTVHWHQGAAAAEVEVDRETGRVTVLRCHGGAYAGRAISPHRVRQQNQGSVIFGLGQALMEEVVYRDGVPANPNLAEYMIPSILDVPMVSSQSVESDDPEAEPHGVGEMALPAVAPAIGNAIFAATGVRLRRLPFTAERVLRALRGMDDLEPPVAAPPP